MAQHPARILHACSSGLPAEKLARAHALLTALGDPLAVHADLAAQIETLRGHCHALDDHMGTVMDLGRLCGQCASRPDGGCCSEYMAGNTDSLQILINLLLGIEVTLRADSGADCCFLGPRGCLFAVKPMFCLNYNCSHILNGAEPGQLAILYQRAAAVLSLQTQVEELLVEAIGRRWDRLAGVIGP